MSYMFNWCESLKELSDISKWNTKNVTNMRHMFLGCESLKELPDIFNGIQMKLKRNMKYLHFVMKILP